MRRFSRTPSALAKFVGTTRATVSEMVKRLEAKGYLERKSSGEDKRSVILCITLRGRKSWHTIPSRRLSVQLQWLSLAPQLSRHTS
ncbi:MarR family winged helix-turn-helix transcriptional regulator [Bradyrhizobium sp. 215_C5_N1_1]|uniref:MarR family winged helix-turn-helix transcriptional regulator n=1 Tax=unclassified Bradyrhizobium TaxID=2631580 RepID=UPI003F8C967C